MAEEAFLNELLAAETDPLAHALLEQFAKIIRDQKVSSSEYPNRVRLLMNWLLNGLIDATDRANGL